MTLSALCCTKCRGALGAEYFNHDYLTACHRCGSMMLTAAFPALLRHAAAPSRGRGQIPAADDEASCFYHPRKQAAVPCDGCGRFLCSLCDVQMGGRHLCPQCIELAASGRAGINSFDNRRVLYDRLALLLAVVPAVVTPLVSLYLAARYWTAPLSVVHRTRLRWYLALIFSVVQLTFWCWTFFSFFVPD